MITWENPTSSLIHQENKSQNCLSILYDNMILKYLCISGSRKKITCKAFWLFFYINVIIFYPFFTLCEIKVKLTYCVKMSETTKFMLHKSKTVMWDNNNASVFCVLYTFYLWQFSVYKNPRALSGLTHLFLYTDTSLHSHPTITLNKTK